MNRSSYSCPVCQPRPRHGRWWLSQDSRWTAA